MLPGPDPLPSYLRMSDMLCGTEHLRERARLVFAHARVSFASKSNAIALRGTLGGVIQDLRITV